MSFLTTFLLITILSIQLSLSMDYQITGYEGYDCNEYSQNYPISAYDSKSLDTCPIIEKCSEIRGVPFKKCSTTQDCKRSEVCCSNPCSNQNQCLLRTNQEVSDNFPEDSFMQCPSIHSCKDFLGEYLKGFYYSCKNNNDCLRREQCCTHPCDIDKEFPKKMCMKTVFTYPQNYNIN